MINQDLFTTYFLVGDKEISINVKNNSNSKIVFFKKKINKNLDNFFFQDIESFFLEKIEEVEGQIKLFIENIVLIIEDKHMTSIEISLKKKIENRKITEEELKNLLSNGLQQIFKNNPDHKIVHFIVDKFNIDGQITDNVENKMINGYLSADLRFICFKKKIINQYKDLFKKKQIFLKKIISVEYLREFKNECNDNYIDMASKIESGYNKLEIKLVPKKTKKKGFFESFFLPL